MSGSDRTYVCPAGFAGTLDNALRRFVHKPVRILEPYIRDKMTVLDLGCGPGYFTAEIARLVGEGGRVIAADLQQRMLEKMLSKIRGTNLEKRIEPHLCQSDRIGITGKVDFVLAFWMVHEVPDQQKMFEELKSILNPNGSIWIIEPKLHVTRSAFNRMIERIEAAGLEIVERPVVSVSRSIMVMIKDSMV